MQDLLPDDLISIASAYDIYFQHQWNGHSPIAELRDLTIYQACHPELEKRRKESFNWFVEETLSEFLTCMTHGFVSAFATLDDAKQQKEIPQLEKRIPLFVWQVRKLPVEIYRAIFNVDEEFRRNCAPFLRASEFKIWFAKQTDPTKRATPVPSRAKLALADHLIELVRCGLFKSSTAEALSQKWNVGSLATKPNPDLFDPQSNPRWTLCMAIAWMAFEDMDFVRTAMPSYREQCTHWAPAKCHLPLSGERKLVLANGEKLEAFVPMTLERLKDMWGYWFDPETSDKKLSVSDAYSKLWTILAEQQLLARGINSANEETDIAAHEWDHLELSSEGGVDCLVARDDGSNNPVYTNVKVSRADLMKVLETGRAEGTSPTIFFAVDAEAKRIQFSTGNTIDGRGYELMAALAQKLKDDQTRDVDESRLGEIITPDLAHALGMNDPALRQLIGRTRAKFEDAEFPRNAIIDNATGAAGYRLNPALLRLEVLELQRYMKSSRLVT